MADDDDGMKLYQGKTNIKVKDMQPDDVWLGSLHGPEPNRDDLTRGLLSPDIRPKGIALHAGGGRVSKYGSSTHVTCKSKG